VQAYQVYRVSGATVTDRNFARRTLVDQTPGTSSDDGKVRGGETYTYFVTARSADGTLSSASNYSTITVPK
jgi:fibronectin type 3 domain-containing protein